MHKSCLAERSSARAHVNGKKVVFMTSIRVCFYNSTLVTPSRHYAFSALHETKLFSGSARQLTFKF